MVFYAHWLFMLALSGLNDCLKILRMSKVVVRSVSTYKHRREVTKISLKISFYSLIFQPTELNCSKNRIH